MKNKLRERLASTAFAFVMLFSSVCNTITFPVKAVSEEQTGAVDADEISDELSYQSFELYPNGEDSEQVITLDGMMPEGAEAEAIDVSEEYSGLVAYDITITDGENEYQPGEDNPVLVEITDPAIPDSNNIELWHIRDDGEREQVTFVTLENGRISFYATGFSVYEVVDLGVSAYSPEMDMVTALSGLTGDRSSDGFYLFYDSNKYFTNTLNSNNALIETNDIAGAAVWYFEEANGSYKIYTYVDKAKKYIHTRSGNELELSGTQADLFELSDGGAANTFYFKKKGANRWLQHSNGGGGIRYYTDNNNATNTRIKLYFADTYSVPDNYYDLDGKTYGLMNFTGGTHGYALMAEDKNVHSLVELVTHQTASADGITLYVDEGSEVTRWTFSSDGNDKYKLSAETEDGIKYLAVSGDDLILVDSVENAASFSAVSDNKGRVQLSSEGKYITFFSSDVNGTAVYSFSLSSNSASPATWLSLLNYAQLKDSDLITYSADRISVSADDLNGTKVILYTRIWDEDNKKYDMYAVDYNGSLYPCYASGGKLLWLGDGTGSLEWEFTEYYDEVTKEPNYYYELYNPYSEKYIAPQISSGQVLSDDTIGINIQGRRTGDFYSEIVAWDNVKYAYVGMKPNDEKTKLVPCSQSACIPFYFATLEDLNLSDKLHDVPTLDNNEHGITMKMFDFDGDKNNLAASYVTANYFNGDYSNSQGLLSTELTDEGYPTVVSTNKSFKNMYADAEEVNHLFLQSVYNSSGYFEYDSCQNFATLNGKTGGDFTVYRELGTVSAPVRATVKHGQFLPYNTIEAGKYPPEKTNPLNLYDMDALASNNSVGILDESDPRKYERLHLIENPDYFFGMEMSASFVQTVSGLDAWGHDIIFDFTGDDDFWLYVDNELVIDLGGTHSAERGRVNFRTGDVTFSLVNGKNDARTESSTTLREIFKANYLKRGMSETAAEEKLDEIFEDNGGGKYIFKDYTTHTMRIFYMERGAGASNLHMRFNLASVVPGHVSVSKTLSGDGASSLDTDFLEYPFQVYYTVDENGNGTIDDNEEYLLGNDDQHIRVTYQNTNQPVSFVKRYRPPGFTDEQAYENIYFINPTKSAEISFPDETIGYRIVECAVDSTVYNNVTINGEAVPDTRRTEIRGLISYSSDTVTAETRPTISFDNHVTDTVIKDLYVTKRLIDEYGNDVTDDPATFNFRLYISSVDVDADSIPPANMYKYYVLSPNKKLCRFDSEKGSFAETALPYSRKAMKALNSYSTENTEDDSDMTEYDSLYSPPIASYGLTADDVTFSTSMFGAISKIPAGYTICVPNLPVGTMFKVTEDVKTGYGIDSYKRLFGDKTDAAGNVTQIASYQVDDGDPENVGRVIADSNNPQMEIRNKKGYGLTVNKKWSDLDITTYHDAVYAAVYVDGTLLEDSVKRIASPSTSAYYFWESLKDGRTSLEDYVVKEVVLTGDNITVSDDNIVTGYDTITPLSSGDEIHLNVKRTAEATPDGETKEAEFNYIVSYDKGSDDSSARTDTITNTREGGLQLRLFQWDSDIPLKDGQFTLIDSSGNIVGNYTSDSAGTINILYNFDKNSLYTLRQKSAPKGFIGLAIPLCFMVDNDGKVEMFYGDGVTEWGTKVYTDNPQRNDNDWAKWKNGENGIVAFVDVYNKPFNFKIMKTDSEDTGIRLGAAHFALYKQANTTISGYVKNKEPMTGFEDLITVDGTVDVCGGDSGRVINPGASGSVYFLTETKAPFNYTQLDEDIIFRISALGVPSLISDTYNGMLIETEDSYIYTLSVPNTKKDADIELLTIEKQVNGAFGNKDKDFSFTIHISDAGEGDDFPWAKNGEEQTAMSRTGGTFTLKHGDVVEISLPKNVGVIVTENNGEYRTAMQLGYNAAQNGNSITFVFTEAEKLIVTNTLDGQVATGIASTFGRAFILITVPAVIIGFTLYRKRRRRGTT